MDEPHAVDSNSQKVNTGILTASENKFTFSKQIINNDFNKAKDRSKLVREGITTGQRIAKISIVTLLSIGIAELVVGYFSGSIVASADGIDSLSDAMISFIVLVGLRIASRPPDKKFHFGYRKVESFAALIAAIGMVVIGAVIFYNSYQVLIYPHEIKHPFVTLLVLAAASVISLHRAFQMRKIANKYNLLSLKTDAKNSIKDGSASVIGFFSVLFATQFGFLQMDAIGGMIIAVFIFSVSYQTLKKSSSILVDSCEDLGLSNKIRYEINQRFHNEIVNIKSILIRSSGMVIHTEIHIEIDGRKRFEDVDLLLIDIQIAVRAKFPNIERVTIIPHAVENFVSQSKLQNI